MMHLRIMLHMYWTPLDPAHVFSSFIIRFVWYGSDRIRLGFVRVVKFRDDVLIAELAIAVQVEQNTRTKFWPGRNLTSNLLVEGPAPLPAYPYALYGAPMQALLNNIINS